MHAIVSSLLTMQCKRWCNVCVQFSIWFRTTDQGGNQETCPTVSVAGACETSVPWNTNVETHASWKREPHFGTLVLDFVVSFKFSMFNAGWWNQRHLWKPLIFVLSGFFAYWLQLADTVKFLYYLLTIFYWPGPGRTIDLVCLCVCVCLFVWTISFDQNDLWPR